MECKNLGVHLRRKHQISKKEYDEIDLGEQTGDFEEIIDDTTHKTVPKEILNNIFEPNKKDPNRPVQDLLNEFDLTEPELRNIIVQYKGGANIPIDQQIKRNEELGNADAIKLKDKDIVKTSSVHVAEALEKDHGFKCKEVRSPRGSSPKTWVMIKV